MTESTHGGRVFRSVPELGLLVRDLRLKRGWTQSELSVKVGVSREWLNGFERGRRDPKTSTLIDLLGEFDLTLDVIPLRRDSSVDQFVRDLLVRVGGVPAGNLRVARHEAAADE